MFGRRSNGMVSIVIALIAASPIMWVEAESCDVACAVKHEMGDSLFASGGHIAPNYWGQTVGDTVTWNLRVDQTLDSPWLALRYAFSKNEFALNPNSPRLLDVKLNGKSLGSIHVPDTGSWLQFDVGWLQLPDVRIGRNTISVVTAEPLTNTDIDCIGLFWNKTDAPDSPFGKTVVARSQNGRFVLRRTAQAKVPDSAKMFREFDRIYDEMDKSAGWTPRLPVGINIVDDSIWPHPEWTAWSNDFGMYLRASIAGGDSGNWCHELTHLMFLGHCPPWLEEPFVRIVTGLVWVDRLYPVESDIKAHQRGIRDAGRDFQEHPEKSFDSIDPILNALADRYGPELLVRFLRASSEAGKRKELDLSPGRKLTAVEIVKYFSKAAGEDVTPYFRRWKGYAAAVGANSPDR